jgi:hypothetical protein
MPDRRILAALDLPVDGDEAEIAEGLRRLSGLSSSAAPDVSLWMRLYEGIELSRHGSTGARGDTALLANRVVEHAIVPPDEDGEERFGSDAWDRELGVDRARSDDVLRRLVAEQIAPRLERAGLYALL